MATTDELFYICFDKATEGDPFADPNPCICKGTIKLHTTCAKEIMNNTESCSICKAKWPEFIGTGVKRTLWPDGKLKEEIQYVNGVRDGPYKKYDPDGELRIEVNYVNGL